MINFVEVYWILFLNTLRIKTLQDKENRSNLKAIISCEGFGIVNIVAI